MIDCYKDIRMVSTDVLVVGSGLAGVMAAIWAAENGVKVMITSETRIFSGSSFSGSMGWLGLLGPENKEDEDDFAQQILRLSRGMAYPELTHTVVRNVLSEVENLRSFGLNVTKKEAKGEKEFISCFDTKIRSFHLIPIEDAYNALSKKLASTAVEQCPNTEIIKLIKNGDAICGAVAVDERGPIQINCKSVILASGGMVHLFKYNFGNSNPAVLGQYLALEAGAALTNIEYMQMMCGIIEPLEKQFFFERAIRFCEFYDPLTNERLLCSNDRNWDEALAIRSTHGPFSSELESKYVDIALYAAHKKNKKGVLSKYKEEIKNHKSDFLDTHFKLLKKEGIGIDDPIIIGSYYHASNGGIKINACANTGIKGLFACGEATGGMHGADRIGGTSFSNCIVFGSIAGREAAKYSKHADTKICDTFIMPPIYQNVKHYINTIQEITFDSMLICRNETDLKKALSEFSRIDAELKVSANSFVKEANVDDLRASVQLKSILQIARAVAEAELLRKESRGSHYREDYPEHDDSLAKRILVSQKPDAEELIIKFES